MLTLAIFVAGIGSLWGQTTTTLINPTGVGGFELGSTPAANGWTATTSTTTTNNQWVVNTGSIYAGSRSAYITNNTSSVPPPNSYTNNVTGVSHIYRDFSIPSTSSSATLSFYWKSNGEWNYDHLRVAIAPNSVTPVYGTTLALSGTAPTGTVNAATQNTTWTNYQASTTWQLVTINIPSTYFNGNTYRLIFQWRNDGSVGSNPPASIDNVSLTYVTPPGCSGTPNAGTASISSASGCSNVSVNLSSAGLSLGTGITYQWQSSTDGGFTWNNIIGATNTTATVTPTATTQYRIRTTCSNSGLSNNTATTTYTVTASGACQCVAYPANFASSTADEEITNVTIGSMNNSSTCATLAGGSGSITNRYSNYAGIVAGPSAAQGATANFSLTQTSCGGAYTNFFQIYVDWNQDGDWLDAGEQVYSQGTTVSGNQTVTGSFSVPITAAIGTTRMRVINIEALPSTTNYTTTAYAWGETEDYCFTITAPCTAPSTQASSIIASSITNSSASIGWTNGNGAGRVVYINTTNSFTAPTNGSNPTANTVYASGQQCVFNGSTSGPVTVTGLATNTTYWVRVYEYCTSGNTYQTASATGNSNNFTTAAACVVSGNPATYGNGSWIGYVYNSSAAGGFDSYQGFVTESEQFNRTHTTIAAGASAAHCSSNTDLFAIRYRMTKNFTAGYYTFTVGGDDGVRLSLDGGATWHINNWVDQAYTLSSSSSAVYLTGNTDLVFEYYENTGGSQSSFSYTYSANAIVPASGNNAYTSCSGTLYDHGGASGNYSAFANGYTVLYPGVAGNFIQLTGTINTESGWDFVYVYNGIGTGGTLLYSGSGLGVNVGTITSTSGPLTVRFTSDDSFHYGGFALNIACVGPPSISSISASPACQGATVTITGSGFTGITGVTFNGVAAASYTVNSATSISAVVPSNGTTGNVLVANSLGSGSAALTVNSSPAAPAVNTVTSSFCGSGGTTAITASGSTGTYAWTALEGSPSLSSATGSTVNATLTQTSAIQVVGTGGSCPSIPATISIGVYPLPGATMAATPNSFCLGTGTAVNVTSGLAAGNFSSVAIPHAPRTAPASATTLCAAGVGTPVPTQVSTFSAYDDGGWSNVPIGFTFDFFGTTYTTLNVGTNGNLTFGTFVNADIADYIFTNLPSTTEPKNMVALLAMDNLLSGANGGTIKYWTEGYAPNRRFVISFENVKAIGSGFSTTQGIFYETTGVIEVHVTSSTNSSTNKVVGVNNGNGTIGVQALAQTTAITTPVAYRFTPPANYTTQWFANGVAMGAAGTNVFTQTGLTPTATTTYSIDYTNQTTGCSNDPANAAIPVTVNTLTLASTATNGDVIWRGATNTDWSTPSNWFAHNGSTYAVATVAPSSTTRTIIPVNQTCVTQQPSVAAGTTVNAKDVVIESGATLTMTTGTLNVNGNFTNNGTFVPGTGKVAFNTAATVSGNATTFNDVDVNNGVNFGSSLSTINGIMTMNTGSWVNTNAPIYGTSSLLKYNTGGPYGRNLEWSATSGAGYPNDVQVSNNTTINYPNTGGAFSTNLSIRRDLTIDAGSNLYMDYNTVNASGSLTVGRNVTVAGDLSLGNQIGGDIYVGGNWTRTTGNFYANNRAVFFNGATGNQTITKAGGETFPFMIVNKALGNVLLANNVTVSGGLTLTSGLVELGANNLIMGGSTLTGGSSTSYVKTSSTGVLSRNVGGSAVTFPVGNSGYNRAVLTNTGVADIFTVRVIDNVTADGTGVGTLTSEPVVQRTWMVNETNIGGSNVILRLYWNGLSEEINGFVQPSAFIAHYLSTDGLWDNIGKTNEGADFVETNSITSFSPFAISSSGTFAPLPIELVSFQANCKHDNSIAVTWVTASEHNTSHYVVEKSRDGITWSVLGQTAAAGNSTELLTYEMIDSEKASGTTYYRLTQFDNDGVFEVFDPVSVNCNGATSNNHITSYPNPSSESFYVSLYTETMEGNGQLTITDASGRPVYSTAVNIQDGNNVFHIGDLNAAPGMYYIQVSNGTTTTHIVKHSLR